MSSRSSLRTLGAVALFASLAACATPPPPPACSRFARDLEGLAAGGGPDHDLQAHALADGRRCLQADFAAFRRVGLGVIDDTRSFALADDFKGHRACAAEVVLVIAATSELGADSFELSDCDGTLSPEERERLLGILHPEERVASR